MELVPSLIPLTFEVTFSLSGLPVAMSVYDTSGMSPALVYGPTAMTNVVANTYSGAFTPGINKNYVILKAVYIDNTFATLDANYSQGSESIYAQYPSGGGSGSCGEIIGYIDNNNTILGLVVC